MGQSIPMEMGAGFEPGLPPSLGGCGWSAKLPVAPLVFTHVLVLGMILNDLG